MFCLPIDIIIIGIAVMQYQSISSKVKYMHIKLLALDMTKLFTTEKNIPAGNKTAIRKYMKNGGIVTIASGRPISGVTRYAEELGLNVGGGYVITYNGSRIFDARTGELLYEKNLSAEQSARIIDVTEKYNVPITTYKGDSGYRQCRRQIFLS